MNQPSPAIVSQGAVRRLPRWALLLFCFSYVLPGFLGREPWRSADVTAFGIMAELANSDTSWLNPSLAGIAPDMNALLPYWFGALALKLAPSWMAADFAVRIPFIVMMGLTLLAVWNGVYYLARSPKAQPVAFAFGGEAQPAEYARALADGGLLAFIACLGLAQLSHETTPAVAQLCFSALSFYAVAALPFSVLAPAIAGLGGLTGLALSGAPSMAILFALGSALICALSLRSDQPERPRVVPWVVALLVLSGFIAAFSEKLDILKWHLQWPQASLREWKSLSSLLVWFTWPAWPLVLWTLWRWRRQVLNTQISLHLALPIWFALLTVGASIFTPYGDRALLLALPALATLSAFALPTLGRSISALIDWFTLLFFSGCAFIIWVVWLAMQTGFPPQPAANVARLAPGFAADFSIFSLLIAILASLSWAWLVKWRVGRHRAAIWKSLVLPAGGAALCWLLLTSLWMPLLDFARSYKPLVQRIENVVQTAECIETFGLQPGLSAAIRFHSGLRLVATNDQASCPWLVVDQDMVNQIPDIINSSRWSRHSAMGHPTPGEEDIFIFKRIVAAGS